MRKARREGEQRWGVYMCAFNSQSREFGVRDGKQGGRQGDSKRSERECVCVCVWCVYGVCVYAHTYYHYISVPWRI